MLGSPPPRSTRPIIAIALMALLGTACGGSDSPTSNGVTPATSTSIEAAADEPDTPSPTAPATTAPPATTPPTTAPVATAPPSTAPPTTSTIVPPDVDLTQFCFESEQAYLAAAVAGAIDEPTPAQAEASIRFLIFTADQSVATAPDGFGEQATRFAEIAREIDDLLRRYDYDAVAFAENEDVAEFGPLFEEYDEIVFDRLIPFLESACGTPISLLDDQALKLAPVIDVATEWPLTAVASQAGDIRLLTPLGWDEATGSVEVDEVTFLQVTPDTAGFESSWDVPGVFVTVFYIEAGVADPALLIPSAAAPADCGAPIAVEEYSDAVYAGELHLYADCAGVGTAAAVLAVANDDGSVEAMLEFQFPGGPDRELLDQMLAGFVVGT